MSEKLDGPPNFRYIVMDNYGNTKEYGPMPSDRQKAEILEIMSSARSTKVFIYELAGVYHSGKDWPFK